MLIPYQKRIIKRLLSKRRNAIWAKMGGGKTVTTLTALRVLMDDLRVVMPIVIAPLRVANTVWAQETQEWSHLKNIRVSIATGSEKQRRKALRTPADLYVINRENVKWLVEYWGDDWPYDYVIIDESSSFKAHDSARFKALESVYPHFDRVTELTASPAPQGYPDLWAQFKLLDGGQRLGKNITAFRKTWFTYDAYGMKYNLRDERAKQEIDERIDDLTTVVNSYKGMPEVHHVYHRVPWTAKLWKQYKDFERESVLELKDVDIEAETAASLINKMLQFCQGAIYDEDRGIHPLHDLKIEALKELRELNADKNVIITYGFRSDIAKLRAAFPKSRLMDREGKAVLDWNKGKISELLLHPASAGHGLNLQHGGSVIIWYGLNWSLELYEQLNARLARRGQKEAVFIHHLMMEKSVEETVLKALGAKDATQQSIIAAIKDRLLD